MRLPAAAPVLCLLDRYRLTALYVTKKKTLHDIQHKVSTCDECWRVSSICCWRRDQYAGEHSKNREIHIDEHANNWCFAGGWPASPSVANWATSGSFAAFCEDSLMPRAHRDDRRQVTKSVWRVNPLTAGRRHESCSDTQWRWFQT